MPSGGYRLTRPTCPSRHRHQEELLQDLSSDLTALARDLARSNADLNAAKRQLERNRGDLDRLIDRTRHCRSRASNSSGGGSSDRPRHRRRAEPRERSQSRSRTRPDARGRDREEGSSGRRRDRHSLNPSPFRGRPRRQSAADPTMPWSAPPLPPLHRRARQPTPARAPRVTRVHISRSSTNGSSNSDYSRVWIQNYLPSFLGVRGGQVHGREGRARRRTTVMTSSNRRH